MHAHKQNMVNRTNTPQGLVLIVDDEPIIVELLQIHLNIAGFNVLTAQDGKEAIRQAEKGQPDVILMDVMLPKLDGFEACRRLKENEATREIAIIFMTALADRSDKIRGFEIGGVDYITKPIEAEEVLARVTTQATLRHLQKKLSQENLRLQQEIIEREYAQEQLRQSEARSRALLGAIPDSMFRLTRDGQCLDCNDNNSLNLLVPCKEFIGKNLSEILPVEIAALFLDYTHKTLTSQSTQVFEYQVQRQYGVQDYETRLVTSGANEVIAMVRNITERKQTEQQTIRNERLAALGQLIATLAHEINNPLQAIQSHLDLVLNYSLEPEVSDKHLRIIRHQIERLNNITRPILNLAHPESTPRQQVSITELIQQALVLVGKQLEQNNIQVVTDLHDVPLVLAIPEQLTQVFLNLALNAIEATSGNGQLCITVYPKGDQVVISFSNKGSTIPSEIMPYIFKPFFTTKSDGSGLGLWISRNLVQQHGGSLTVANLTNDTGVVFTIKLPCILRTVTK